MTRLLPVTASRVPSHPLRRRSSSFGAMAMASVILLASACATPPHISLGEVDAGRTVKVGVGSPFTVALPSNATTGFRWTVAAPGPVEQVGESNYTATQDAGVVGAGGVETFTFRAVAQGSGDLVLEYRRPWETDVAAEKAWRVTITAR